MASNARAGTAMEDRTEAALLVIKRIAECSELTGVRAMAVGSMALCHWEAQFTPEPESGIGLENNDIRYEVRRTLAHRFPRDFDGSEYLPCLGMKGTGILVSRGKPVTYVSLWIACQKLPIYPPDYSVGPSPADDPHLTVTDDNSLPLRNEEELLDLSGP
ncbi:hypothetical protein BDV06DRAFT_221726 [Aspergillus oleicola]